MRARLGRFITFEGPEGGGKTTQALALCETLAARDIHAICLREPGGTPTGEAIRDILQHDASGEPICDRAEALLFAASRAQLVRVRILPALEQGHWVVCDRFADSTTAYQGFGRGFGVERMETINAFAIDEAVPDLTLLLDLDSATAGRRMQTRNRASGASPDRIERESAAIHQRVREGYLELARRNPGRFAVVDAAQEEEAVAAAVWSHVERLINR